MDLNWIAIVLLVVAAVIVVKLAMKAAKVALIVGLALLLLYILGNVFDIPIIDTLFGFVKDGANSAGEMMSGGDGGNATSSDNGTSNA